MKIQFHEKTWVLKRDVKGDFCGGVENISAALIKPIPFDVISVTRDKKTQCSTIYVWNDGCLDGGDSVYLINVPNGTYKQISDEDYRP